jgi:HEAT repeat protein
VLAELLRDKSVAIRKRALCALGELLFYIATQKQVSMLPYKPY